MRTPNYAFRWLRAQRVTQCSACETTSRSDLDECAPDTCEECGHVEGSDDCECRYCEKERQLSHG